MKRRAFASAAHALVMGGLMASGLLAGAVAKAGPLGRIPAQRSHAQCPAPGLELQGWIIDNARQWAALATLSEEQALGRPARWGREQWLVLALPQQPTLGVRVSLGKAWRGQRAGELQVQALVNRPGQDEAAATAISRPCVVAALPPGPWRRVSARVEGRTVVARRAQPGQPNTASGQPAAKSGGPILINEPPPR